ncbi:LAETG motif-containing sortase-dependent surface protein [Streptomyces sp. NPDC006365]|uniref:LAETG motif-containing sortase-dependent surface protein n=1 Tax=Streptomyces sp. NPDC006365 TaxID=3364744 RepID=UPI0036B3E0E9
MPQYTGLFEVFMKLRRALAAAAATAVIAPLSLLSAPVVYATDGDTTTTTTTTGGSTGGDTATGGDTTGGDDTTEDSTGSDDDTATGGDTTGGDDTTGDNTGSDDDTATGGDDTTGGNTGSGDDATGDDTGAEDTSGDDQSGEDDEKPSPSPSEGPDVTVPALEEELPFCEEVDDQYASDTVVTSISGLPGKIAAGSGFHGFTINAANKSDFDVKKISLFAEVENYELDENKYLSPFVTLQYKSKLDGTWKNLGDADWAGGFFSTSDVLKSGESISYEMRVSIAKNAPAGDAYSFAAGVYVDNVKGKDCVAGSEADYDFVVLAAGVSNPDPGIAKPGDGEGKPADGKPTDGKRPQGGLEKVSGELAETGSSSNLPVIGTVGGIAIVAGAGVVFAMKRRKTGADA